MKDRILKGWNYRRVMYLVFGCIAVAQAFMTKQYFLVLFGVYFAAMGLLGFGCAGGHCAYVPPPAPKKETGDNINES
ncbi:MAG: hypothetical protein H6551_11935 [Chitinophagales bacterium]|nr:hypothetical protein [Chitinophagaceae bacterium]MCB9065839.1 hypothetical protein [Chitinophagales bacterium]